MAEHKRGTQWQLCSSQCEGGTRRRFVNTIHFVQHFSGLDFSYKVLGVAFAVTHTHFSRLLANRFVGENPDKYSTTPLDVSGHGTSCSFDLTRC